MGCHQSAGLLIFLLVAFVTVPLLGALAGATLAGKLAGGDDALLVAGFSILVGVPTLVLVVMSSDLSFVADVALPFGMALVFGTAAAVTRLAAEASKQRGSYGRPPLTVLLVAPWIACFVAILVNVD